MLIVSGIMYKCTDGTMNASDLSFKDCFSFGDGSEDKPQEDKGDTDVTASPLLSNDFSMGNLIGSGSIDNEDDEGEVDYGTYMDYYKSSTTAVRAREEIMQVCLGIRDNLPGGCGADEDLDGNPVDGDQPVDSDPPIKVHTDYLDVDAKNGVGECAKICYDQDETIGGKACNAFQMNNDNKKCRLFWSQSESENNGGRTNKVYRLKNPRSPSDHESQLESDYYDGSSVVTFRKKDYVGEKNELGLGQHNIPNGAKSIIIPQDKCVLGFNAQNLGGERLGSAYFGMDTSRTIINESGSEDTIQSVDIGSWADGMCTWYPRDAEAAKQHPEGRNTATLDTVAQTTDGASPSGASPVAATVQSCTNNSPFPMACSTNSIDCSDYTDQAMCEQIVLGPDKCCTWG